MNLCAATAEKNCRAPGSLRQKPYRLFFPLGLLGGISGVFHWAWFAFGEGRWNVPLHTALQFPAGIFLIAIGFLFTSVPRITGTGPVSRREFASLIAGAFLILVAAWTGKPRLIGGAAGIFAALAGGLITVRHRRGGGFPPSFPWIYVGLGFAAIGGALEAAGFTATALWTQGFILPLVFATAPLIGAHILGRPPAFRGTKRGCSFQLAALIASFAIELFSLETRPVAHLLRALVAYLSFRDAELWGPLAIRRAHGIHFKISAFAIPLGYIAAAIAPSAVQATNALHITFISGFALMIAAVVWHVALAHAGEAHEFTRLAPAMHFIGGATITAAILRSGVGFFPEQYGPVIGTAAIIYCIAQISLGTVLLPRFLERRLPLQNPVQTARP